MALGFEYIEVKVVMSMSVRISLDGAVVAANEIEFSVCVVV